MLSDIRKRSRTAKIVAIGVYHFCVIVKTMYLHIAKPKK